MKNTITQTMLLATTVLLAACNGGGGSSSDSGNNNGGSSGSGGTGSGGTGSGSGSGSSGMVIEGLGSSNSLSHIPLIYGGPELKLQLFDPDTQQSTEVAPAKDYPRVGSNIQQDSLRNLVYGVRLKDATTQAELEPDYVIYHSDNEALMVADLRKDATAEPWQLTPDNSATTFNFVIEDYQDNLKSIVVYLDQNSLDEGFVTLDGASTVTNYERILGVVRNTNGAISKVILLDLGSDANDDTARVMMINVDGTNLIELLPEAKRDKYQVVEYNENSAYLTFEKDDGNRVAAYRINAASNSATQVHESAIGGLTDYCVAADDTALYIRNNQDIHKVPHAASTSSLFASTASIDCKAMRIQANYLIEHADGSSGNERLLSTHLTTATTNETVVGPSFILMPQLKTDKVYFFGIGGPIYSMNPDGSAFTTLSTARYVGLSYTWSDITNQAATKIYAMDGSNNLLAHTPGDANFEILFNSASSIALINHSSRYLLLHSSTDTRTQASSFVDLDNATSSRPLPQPAFTFY